MRIQFSLLALMICAAILCFSCRSGVEEEVHENPEASHKILITGTSSEFKGLIIQSLLERYGSTLPTMSPS